MATSASALALKALRKTSRYSYRDSSHILSKKTGKPSPRNDSFISPYSNLHNINALPIRQAKDRDCRHISYNLYRDSSHIFTVIPVTFLNCTLFHLTKRSTEASHVIGACLSARTTPTVIPVTFLPSIESHDYRTSDHTRTVIPVTKNTHLTVKAVTFSTSKYPNSRQKQKNKYDLKKNDLKKIISDENIFFTKRRRGDHE